MTKTAVLYGGSLYDLAQETDSTQELLEQFEVVRDVFRENPEYLRLLSEPSLAASVRCGLIDEALPEANRYLVNFLKLLCERGLLGDLGGCCEEFTRRYREDAGIACAVVTSAMPLDEKQQEALKHKLEELSGKKVLLTVREEKSLLGGIKVELEGRELDGSVKGRLTEISRRISEVSL